MLEKSIEARLSKAARKLGGLSLKLYSPSYVGMPDRIVLLPGGTCAFVEVKAPGKRPRAVQLRRHSELRGLGFRVYVLDDPADIGRILGEIGGREG